MIITSAANEQIKRVKKLIKSSKERREEGLYVVEGIRMVHEIPSQDVDSIYVAESAMAKFQTVLAQFRAVEPIAVKDHVFDSMSDTNTPQGIMALVRMQNYKLQDVLGEIPFVLIVEHLQDPGNMGTIIRTAEGAGATGVIISSDSVDIYNPKVIRSTMGSVFRVPIYVSNDLKKDIDRIRGKDITVYAAHLNGRQFYDNDYTKGSAFLIGNEGNGLSDEISAKANSLLKIPMMGSVESLNAATSTAVICYEVLRQRFFSK